MINRKHKLPIARQAEVLRISRGSVYYLPRPVSAADLEVMRRVDRLHLEYPFAGSRMLRGLLATEGIKGPGARAACIEPCRSPGLGGRKAGRYLRTFEGA